MKWTATINTIRHINGSDNPNEMTIQMACLIKHVVKKNIPKFLKAFVANGEVGHRGNKQTVITMKHATSFHFHVLKTQPKWPLKLVIFLVVTTKGFMFWQVTNN